MDVETRYGTTRVRRSGVGRGTPVVLLPGFMGTSLTWYPHVADLSERHEVYAVDTLGEPGLSVQTRWLLPPALLRLTTTGDPTIRPLLFGGLKFKAHLAPQHTRRLCPARTTC
ncbi:alpha/beta fold hydrolase [Actinokineospora globicatena]|uniref:alpha/beta fold hydrolase n=1 Tax=Actinokineospora globicatena TaxID=103729 RepID=UPI0020A2FC01|nr:hypothetical protein [Actinokineospora globicatena]MCP2306076.1 hypothetical protein [Actinokineospora globicatena]GLW80051.1 hypothetical protein Aglo01_45320 [Actinokineospora globicatena]GLW86880.1 hypothetical protein Aglo02_45190 [Actinokineospora globicatena]